MIYSILANYLSLFPLSPKYQAFLTSILEITTGIHKLANAGFQSSHMLGAILVGIVSFGGLSALSQTKSVMDKSHTSMLPYCIIKIIFGFISGFLYYLFI